MQAEIAERLVEFEWPDKSELTAAKLKEIEASVPIPERVWALKNVGRTQALSGPEGRARARQLLERAVSLKRELVLSAKHPGIVFPQTISSIVMTTCQAASRIFRSMSRNILKHCVLQLDCD